MLCNQHLEWKIKLAKWELLASWKSIFHGIMRRIKWLCEHKKLERVECLAGVMKTICPKNERSRSCQKICKQLRTQTNTFYGIKRTAAKSSSWAAKWHQQETQTSILGTCNQHPDRETFAVNCHSALTRLQRQKGGGGQMILLEYWPVKWKYLIRVSSMVWKEDIFQNSIIIMQDNTPSHAAQKRTSWLLWK